MAGIKGAIFDLDGTLFDSMGIWDDVDRAFFHLHGREMPPGYVDALNTMSFSEGAEYTRALIGYELTADEIIAEWHGLSVKLYAEDVRLKPEAEELLGRFSESGISMAIATDLDEELALPALRNNGIDRFFPVVSTTKAAGKDKRSPDVYLNAARALGLRPEECLVFEDILKGIRTAAAAGFLTAAVYDSSSDKDWNDIVKVSDMSFRTLQEALSNVLDC